MMTTRWALATAAAVTLVAAACAGPVAQETPSTPPSADAPVALFLGDSYAQGTGLSESELPTRWTTVLSGRAGWSEINAGCNGSGYTRRGGVCATNYVERVPALANADPDIVIVSGGVNDLSASRELIDMRVPETFTALREAFPEAQIYAVNGIYYTGLVTPALLAYLNEAVEHAVTEVGGSYVDIGEPLLGHPELMGPDTLHPNSAGHALITDLTLQELSRVGGPVPSPSDT
ncbi:SGNH/GDSL hydrolase family protein [Demequina oxidasica]|uniref:SGNH/GDSL hydrolase family protein n=1 Tax=Demequina oxidasica TaxID=676199 RepID=UPI0007816C8F|nr:SGNH/GDSL hydrolase family protein [Demequina oxidasica]